MSNYRQPRVFMDPSEYDKMAERSAHELDASLPDVLRTLARLWMNGEITISAEDMVRMRGRSVQQ